jgi:hypothetical protein
MRTPHSEESYKKAIVSIINLIAVKRVKLADLKDISRQYNVSNTLGYYLKNINVIKLQEGYVLMNPDWTMKLSLNPKETIDEIYQLCKNYLREMYRKGNLKAKERKQKQRKLEEQKQTQLQLQTPAVPSINDWLSQLPIEDIIRFVQYKNYIVLTR